MMRNACGSNDHPDSTLFIQVYKLISTYSQLKPPKGSNVASDEIFSTLINLNDVKAVSNENVLEFRTNLDLIVESCIPFEDLIEVPNIHDEEHDYHIVNSSSYVIAYFGGYIARKSKRFTNCDLCLNSLSTKNASSKDKFTEILSKGYLLYPSDALYSLVKRLEDEFLHSTRVNQIDANIILKIIEDLHETDLNYVGCNTSGHAVSLTEKIIDFCL